MKTVFPKFNYPGLGEANPFMEKINAQVTQWINEYTCISDELKAELKKGKFGYLSSRVFPHADFERLTVGTRYFLWVFVHDDHYGPLPSDELRQICNTLNDTLRGQAATPPANEIYQQMAIMREELLQFATPAWMNRFAQDMQDYYDAMLIDSNYSYKEAVRYPSLEEYLPLRDKICGAYPTMDMVELCADAILPQAIFEHPYIQALRDKITRTDGIRNDISSACKEKKDKEAMNILLVIQHEQQCSFEQALDIAVQHHEKALQEFLDLSTRIPDFGPLNELVKKYVIHLQLMTEGHNAWYIYSHRYGVKDQQPAQFNNPAILAV